MVREKQTEVQAAEDREDRQDQRQNRRYTLGLSFVTLLVLACQVALLVGQNRIGKAQNRIMARQSAIMSRQRKTTDAMLVANQEAERAFLHIHTESFTITPFEIGKIFRITFKVQNSGRTHAIVEHVQSRMNREKFNPPHFLPADPDQFFANTDNQIGLPTIAPNSHDTRYFKSSNPLTAEELNELTSDKRFIRLAIRIKYKTVSGDRYELGFAAGYDWGAQRFLVIADPNYNYSKKR